MMIGGGRNQLVKLLLKLRAAIGLDGLTMTEGRHQDLEGGLAVLSRQTGLQDHQPFASADVNSSKGKHTEKVNRIHLDDLARPTRLWQGASAGALVSLRAQLQVLVQDAIDGATAQLNTFLLQSTRSSHHNSRDAPAGSPLPAAPLTHGSSDGDAPSWLVGNGARIPECRAA